MLNQCIRHIAQGRRTILEHHLESLKARHVVFVEDQLCQICFKRILNQVFGCVDGKIVHVYCLQQAS
jgi:hypothetical protein